MGLLKRWFRRFYQALAAHTRPRRTIEDPERRLAREQDRLCEKIAAWNRILADREAERDALAAQVDILQKQADTLAADLRARLAADDRTIAGRLALRLKSLRKELGVIRQRATDAADECRERTALRDRLVATAKAALERLRAKAVDARYWESTAQWIEAQEAELEKTGLGRSPVIPPVTDNAGDERRALDEFLAEENGGKESAG